MYPYSLKFIQDFLKMLILQFVFLQGENKVLVDKNTLHNYFLN